MEEQGVEYKGAGPQPRCATRRTRVPVTLLLLYAKVNSPRLPPHHFAEGTAFLCHFRWLTALRMRQRGLGHLTRIPSYRASQTPASTLPSSGTRTVFSSTSNSSSNISITIQGTRVHLLPSGTSMLDHSTREEGGSVR